MMPSETATTISPSQGRQQKNQQQQQETRQGDVIMVEMKALKALDRHIETLEAKLSFLIRLCDDPSTDLSYQYDKKISTVKQEINEAMERRPY
jgi:uncharacterized FlaG/YvyC family protein